jgi:hypothetical protein
MKTNEEIIAMFPNKLNHAIVFSERNKLTTAIGKKMIKDQVVEEKRSPVPCSTS